MVLTSVAVSTEPKVAFLPPNPCPPCPLCVQLQSAQVVNLQGGWSTIAAEAVEVRGLIGTVEYAHRGKGVRMTTACHSPEPWASLSNTVGKGRYTGASPAALTFEAD